MGQLKTNKFFYLILLFICFFGSIMPLLSQIIQNDLFKYSSGNISTEILAYEGLIGRKKIKNQRDSCQANRPFQLIN
jgi:hypothetical protein